MHSITANNAFFIEIPEQRATPLPWFHWRSAGSHRNTGFLWKNQSQHRWDQMGDELTNHQQEYL